MRAPPRASAGRIKGIQICKVGRHPLGALLTSPDIEAGEVAHKLRGRGSSSAAVERRVCRGNQTFRKLYLNHLFPTIGAASDLVDVLAAAPWSDRVLPALASARVAAVLYSGAAAWRVPAAARPLRRTW